MRAEIWICLAALAFVACTSQKPSEEQAIRSMCTEMLQRYPQATLQDVYKTCFQDFFGAEHLLNDTASAHRYLSAEIETSRDQNLTAMPLYEPTGFRHRFTRVNLSLVHSGDMSEDELFARFLEAAGTNNRYSDNWADEWKRIETIVLEMHPAWKDTVLQAELHYAASIPCAVRHSDPFRRAYNPHYRIIENGK